MKNEAAINFDDHNDLDSSDEDIDDMDDLIDKPLA